LDEILEIEVEKSDQKLIFVEFLGVLWEVEVEVFESLK
jgi:hypothetical protein